MFIKIHVLGSGAVLVSLEAKSSLSRTENRIVHRCIVNPGEGTQRDLQHLQWSTAQLGLLAMTRLEPSTSCGLAGLYFAMSDTGAGVLNVRGPRRTGQFVNAWSPFVRRKFPVLAVKEVECDLGKQARVERMEHGMTLVSVSLKRSSGEAPRRPVCVWCMMDKADSSSSSESSSESSSSDDEEEEEEQEVVSKPVPCVAPPPPPSPSPVFAGPSATVCYLMRMGSGGDGAAGTAVVGVIDCQPIEHDLAALGENPHLAFACPRHAPALIVHLASNETCASPSYVAWQKSLPATLQHVYAHASRASHRRFPSHVLKWQHALHAASPSHYQQPPPRPRQRAQSFSIAISSSPSSTVEVTRVGDDEEEEQEEAVEVAATTATAATRMEEEDENEILLDDDEASVPRAKQLRPTASSSSRSPFLLFLGTGAAKPSSFRGLSACLLHRGGGGDGGGSVLLDCGEDTIHQLARCEQQGDNLLVQSIQCVWISHHHLDHFGGVCSIVYERFHRFAGARTTVLAPHTVLECLRGLFPSDMVELGHSQAPLPGNSSSRTFRAIHCYDSYGIAIDLKENDGGCTRVVYSGDTRPNPGALAASASSSSALPVVLIHEATFEDALQEEACKKKHSTVGEAKQVAKQMGASVLLLTHASQRYPKHLGGNNSHNGGDDEVRTVQVHDFFRFDLSSAISSSASVVVGEEERELEALFARTPQI